MVMLFSDGSKIQQHINGDKKSPLMLKTSVHPEEEVRISCPLDPVSRMPPNDRTVKGKSSLLLTISTFGYQILRYPHFAELCWATSKLKDGPYTDINGSWKGWPFNSCIIRPNNSLEKVAVGCRSSNLKIKEHSGLVRGLVAVGLLAYRGVYTSVREISFEVRKVLELLVEQVNTKIQGGEDRFRFLRILSQVAYLEDMVNSWTYMLQSLELDSRMPLSNPRRTMVDFPDNNNTWVDGLVRSDACKPNVTKTSSCELKLCGGISQSSVIGNSECHDSNEGVTHLDLPNSEERVVISEQNLPQQMAPSTHSAPGILESFSSATNPFVNENGSDERYTHSVPCRSENPVFHAEVPFKHTNGLAMTESVVPSEDGVCTPEVSGVVMISSSRKVTDQFKGLSQKDSCYPSEDGTYNSHETPGDIEPSFNKSSSLSAASGVACHYSCCSQCLHTVNVLIRKILVHEWASNESYWAVDDVHDVVASWSVNLLSAVRKFYTAESVGNPKFFGEKLRHENLPESHDVDCIQLKKTSCQCISSRNRAFMPMECSCHSGSQSPTAKTNACTNSFELGLNFFFRDGVLVPSDPRKDVLLHCKFKNLCLCSLIEWILMIMQPLD